MSSKLSELEFDFLVSARRELPDLEKQVRFINAKNSKSKSDFKMLDYYFKINEVLMNIILENKEKEQFNTDETTLLEVEAEIGSNAPESNENFSNKTETVSRTDLFAPFYTVVEQANEALTGYKTFQRVGNNKQLHGSIIEDILKDMINAKSCFSHKGASLSLSKTDPLKDIIVKDKSGIVKYLQVKNYGEKSIKYKLIPEIKSGRYKGAELIGSRYTAKRYNELRSDDMPPMINSGISRNKTLIISKKIRGVIPSVNELKKVAMGSGIKVFIFSAAISSLVHFRELKNGKVSIVRFFSRVAKESVCSAVSVGAAAIGCALITPALISAPVIAGTLALPLAAGIAASCIIATVSQWIWGKLFAWI